MGKGILRLFMSNPISLIWFGVYTTLLNFKLGLRNVRFAPTVNRVTGAKYMQIGERTGFGKRAIITAIDSYLGDSFSPKLIIGKRCAFGDYVHITTINQIRIGNDVLTGRWVTITDNSHGNSKYESLCTPPLQRKLFSKGPVCIEDNVWIGDKVTILPGVTVGRGSIIAANAVVTKSIPAFCVAAGNPAKVVKQVFPDNE